MSSGVTASHPGRGYTMLAVLLMAFVVAMPLPAWSQVSPEEHAKHHPDAGAPGTQSPPSTMGSGTAPPGGMSGGMGGMMGEMGGMMGGMGTEGAQGRPLIPSMMTVPEPSPQQRETLLTQARERMKTGVATMQGALEQLSSAAQGNDPAAMRSAAENLREGLSVFESGLSVSQALAEGQPPGQVALGWFKDTLHIRTSVHELDREEPRWLGLTPFHFVTMALLIGFTVVMLGMYFFKMRHAVDLLGRLTSPGGMPPAAAPTVPPAPLPPMAPGPGPSSPPPEGTSASPTSSPPQAVASSTAPAPAVAALPRPMRWAGTLKVARVFAETPNIKTFRLVPAKGGPLPFTYLPGQFLNLAFRLNGQLVRRSYTIASSPTQLYWLELTIKREEKGLVSRYLHDNVHEGGEVEVNVPFGTFTFTGREADSIALIGGGVGLTPLMSVLRFLTDTGWPGDIFLVHACRTLADFLFREEIQSLQKRHPNLHVFVAVTQAEAGSWSGPVGRLTRDMLASAIPAIQKRRIHLCGPGPMMDSMKALLAELHVPKENIKTENFSQPSPERAEAPRRKEAAPALPPTGAGAAGATVQPWPVAAAVPTVTFTRSKKMAPLPPGQNVLEAAEEVGVEIPWACRVGTCGTCKVQLVSGRVTMAVEDGLDPGDKERGLILACQAVATDNIQVEA